MGSLLSHFIDLGITLYDTLLELPALRLFTGVLGIAFALAYLRRANPALRGASRGTSGAGGAAASLLGRVVRGAMPDTAAVSPAAAKVRARLGGARRVVVSVPGVLISAEGPRVALWDSGEVAVLPEAARALALLKTVSDLYLVACVADDASEAAVRQALSDAGLVGGSDSASLPPHRLLFCSTRNEGKVAIARQLEPDLYIDSDRRVIEELGRFFRPPKQLALIRGPGEGGVGGGMPPVALEGVPIGRAAEGLAAYLGVAGGEGEEEAAG